MSDLDVLFPGQEIQIGEEKILIKPFTFGQLPAAAKYLAPVAKAVREAGIIGGEVLLDQLVSMVDVLSIGGEDAIKLIAFAAGKDRPWFDKISMDDGLKLAKAVWDVNADFFLRSLPGLDQQEEKAPEAGATS